MVRIARPKYSEIGTVLLSSGLNSRSSLYLPWSHVVPVYPPTQVQVKSLVLSVHMPPFWHGEVAHSSVTEARKQRSKYTSTKLVCQTQVVHWTYVLWYRWYNLVSASIWYVHNWKEIIMIAAFYNAPYNVHLL